MNTMEGFMGTASVAMLTGESDRRVQEKTKGGLYQAVKMQGQRGGVSGEKNLIAVQSLPIEAQIAYLEMNGVLGGVPMEGCDLAGYKERYGLDGLKELLMRQQAAKEALALVATTAKGSGRTEVLEALAAKRDVTSRTLRRWAEDYQRDGLRALMRPIHQASKGTRQSLCPAAYQYVCAQYLDDVKRTQSTVYAKLIQYAASKGPDACAACLFNEACADRERLTGEGLAVYQPCAFPKTGGLVVPACRQTLSRILADIPQQDITLARRGAAAWKNGHMLMASRSKPERVNECWFGDHHQFDCFVLDTHGKPVRPWLTAWYDAATGCMVSWSLTLNPNAATITETFIRGVSDMTGDGFYGLPAALYIDNGKDYRSRVFEGDPAGIDLGYLNANIAESSVIQLFGVRVHHAVPYHAWSKTVERFFGTLEDIWIREVPGWCGGSPDERPENLAKQIRQLIERGEMWTLDEFYAYLRNTVFPAYHARPHDGHAGHAPAELYASLPRARDDLPSWEMLSIARENATTRVVQQIGIRFGNELYWDDALIPLIGKTVTLRYSASDMSSVTVIWDNRYICEAGIKARMQLIGEEQDVLGAHMAKQKRQLHEAKDRVRRASQPAFYEEIVAGKKSRANITSMEYERAARGKTAHKKRAAEEGSALNRQAKDEVQDMFIRRYEEANARAQ